MIEIPYSTAEYRSRYHRAETGKDKELRAVHIGISPENLDRLPLFWADKNKMAVTVDGDGWNAWGEAPGTDVNDETTLHVVYLTHDDRALRDWILTSAGDVLVPMGGGDQQEGAILVSTRPTAWSEDQVTLFVESGA